MRIGIGEGRNVIKKDKCREKMTRKRILIVFCKSKKNEKGRIRSNRNKFWCILCFVLDSGISFVREKT